MKKYVYMLFLGTMSLVQSAYAQDTAAEQQRKKNMAKIASALYDTHEDNLDASDQRIADLEKIILDLNDVYNHEIPDNYDTMNDIEKQQFDHFFDRIADNLRIPNNTRDNMSVERKKIILTNALNLKKKM